MPEKVMPGPVEDVYKRQIQERVFAQAGVRLEPEVRIID